jgi:signal peptidase I
MLSLPPMVYFIDTFFAVHKVQDNSDTHATVTARTNKDVGKCTMDPVLQQGDIILIRKVDFLPHYFKKKLTLDDLMEPDNNQSIHADENERVAQSSSTNTNKNHNTHKKSLYNLEEDIDRRKSLQMDATAGKSGIDGFTIWRSPPIFLPGDVVAFTNPHAMERVEVSRVIGIGGQRIRPRTSYHKIEYLGAYSLWVEGDCYHHHDGDGKGDIDGDNETNRIGYSDGKVSKKLVHGIVDRVLWPPSRMGKVHRVRPPIGRMWWP